jgi:hypothetical protein
MRKCVFAVVFLIHAFVFSQEEVKKDNIDFGFRFGLSISDLITETNSIQPRASFHTGLHLLYKTDSFWSFQAELLYLRKGQSERSTDLVSNNRIENKTKLDYIEFPLLAKYRLTEGFHIEMGPYVSTLISAEEESLSFDNVVTNNIKNEINTFDMGLAIGAGYTTPWNFFMGLRFTRGFINTVKNNNSGLEESYNTQLQLYVGYLF